MDEFLKIVYLSQEESGAISNPEDCFEPLKKRLKELLSPTLYDEAEEILNECIVDDETYYAVAGMKLAIGVMGKTYKPVF
jgi:hypothetical protein